MAECGFIGCSPDGIVFDSAEGEGLLEVKCPYSARDMDVETGCLMLDNFCASLSPGGTPTLKRNHDYYFQIQGSLGILGLQWCDFVLWTPEDMSIERIRFDPQLWESFIQPKLHQFFSSYVLPELVLPVYPHGKIVARRMLF